MSSNEPKDSEQPKVGKVSPFDDSQQAGLLVILKQLGKYHSRDAENVFDKGVCFMKAQAITGTLFPVWLRTSTNYTTRTAYDYMEIVRELGKERDRYIKAGALFTIMKELLTASASIRETVLDRLTAGERVTRADVIKLKMQEKGGVPLKPKPAYDTPGISGLRRLIDEKSKSTSANFLITVAAILEGIDRLLLAEARLKKPIGKRDLTSPVGGPAKLARTFLTHIAIPLAVENRTAVGTGFLKGSLWDRIYNTLDVLSSEAELAKIDGLAVWLRDEVHPLLTTVIGAAVQAFDDEEHANQTQTSLEDELIIDNVEAAGSTAALEFGDIGQQDEGDVSSRVGQSLKAAE
jgi:hypothetical protein